MTQNVILQQCTRYQWKHLISKSYILFSGNSLCLSGYHLCTHNETKIVSFLVVHKVPYSVSKPCGGWLLWKTCNVTMYRMIHQTEYKLVTEQVMGCCSGYVQVGRYCALHEYTTLIRIKEKHTLFCS